MYVLCSHNHIRLQNFVTFPPEPPSPSNTNSPRSHPWRPLFHCVCRPR